MLTVFYPAFRSPTCNSVAGLGLCVFTCIVLWLFTLFLKGHSHGHRDVHRMRIQSGLLHSHESTWKPMRIECTLSPVNLVRWIETGSHYYSWFTHGYAYHEVFGLLIGLAFRGLWRVLYRYFLFCSCSDIGEERGLFSEGWEEWYSMVN